MSWVVILGGGELDGDLGGGELDGDLGGGGSVSGKPLVRHC